jgi:signal transduction histidine kinase
VQNRLIIAVHRLTELERQASSAELANELAELRLKVREVLDTQVRPISHRLYPSILRRGLVAALQSLADQFETALAIEMALDAELALRERSEPQLILEQVRLAAYRIAEEALTNVVKHAQGSRVDLELKTVGMGWLCLKLRDDGQGFDVAGASRGRGLVMMQDYAEVAGGLCTIRSALGEGTDITAILPLEGPPATHLE